MIVGNWTTNIDTDMPLCIVKNYLQSDWYNLEGAYLNHTPTNDSKTQLSCDHTNTDCCNRPDSGLHKVKNSKFMAYGHTDYNI